MIKSNYENKKESKHIFTRRYTVDESVCYVFKREKSSVELLRSLLVHLIKYLLWYS